MKKEDLRKLLSLESSIDITNVDIKKEGGKNNKYVYVKSNKKKARCLKCGNFSNKLHDYLKPVKIVYLKNSGENTYLIASKRRFKCKACKKTFTEDLGLNGGRCSISYKTKQMILKECLDRNKTLEDIAKDCNVSTDTVRRIFLEAMKNYPENVDTLPEVISFDETSTYTCAGTYSFVLNDPIHKITLDILSSRKKDFLISYFSKVKNRKLVKVVICDLKDHITRSSKFVFQTQFFAHEPFHYTRYVLKGLDDVRIRLQNEYEENKKSYEYRMLKNRVNSKLILKAFDYTKG
ncbi:MAG: transposase [Bacilli bacterium]|nr:transposase [Bacilli bacterium]